MLISILLVALGFVALIVGANWLVDGASALAKKYRIPDLVIGLTIVAFGTSAPELVVNSIASFNNQSELVLGNVIGSNIFNLFMILGIAGLIMPISVQSTTVWKEIPISLLAALILLLFANELVLQDSHSISRFEGIVLLGLFLVFLLYAFNQLKADEPQELIQLSGFSMPKIWIYIILGLAGLLIGGKLVVDNAIDIATNLGVSQKIIGLTIVAAGTSLPELFTSVVAALKRNSDIAIGNVIGSNIFNILFILSISSIITPIEFNLSFNTDLYLLIGGTIFLFAAMFTGQKKKLDRWEAGVLLMLFIAYTIYSIRLEV